MAQQRVWEEHLLKVAAQERRYAAEGRGPAAASFSVNPTKLKSKTMTDPKINRRDARFLDRERAALAAIQKQLADRVSDESKAGASSHGQPSALPAITSPARQAASAGAADASRPSFEPLPALASTSQRGATKSAAAGDERLREAMSSVHKGPTAKYSFPQTESQELGWMSQPLVRPERQFRHGLKSCDVTKFATFAVSRK